MRPPPRPCANCQGDINILTALRGQPRPHMNAKYCSDQCRKAAKRKRKNNRLSHPVS